jgi:hypothetical protein
MPRWQLQPLSQWHLESGKASRIVGRLPSSMQSQSSSGFDALEREASQVWRCIGFGDYSHVMVLEQLGVDCLIFSCCQTRYSLIDPALTLFKDSTGHRVTGLLSLYLVPVNIVILWQKTLVKKGSQAADVAGAGK